MKKLVLLSLSVIASFNLQAQDCSELFFSEYVEGSHNNKALEIYNPTQAAIDLGTYRIVRWSNGSSTSDEDIRYVQPLTGTIQALSTYIIALDKQSLTGTGNDTALFGELLTKCQTAEAAGNGGFYSPNYESGDQGSRTIYHNGNDAISLQKTDGSAWNDVDIFGVIGELPNHPSIDPAGWSDESPYWDGQGTFWTRDHTLIRKASVKKGITVRAIPFAGAFDPSVEYDSLPENTFDDLGEHVCECAQVGISEQLDVNWSVYPNPSGTGQVQISAEDQFRSVRIFNILGEEVFAHSATSTTAVSIDTRQFESGIYIIQLEFDEGSATRKLVLR